MNSTDYLDSIEKKFIDKKEFFIGDVADVATWIFFHNEILALASKHQVTLIFHKPNKVKLHKTPKKHLRKMFP